MFSSAGPVFGDAGERAVGQLADQFPHLADAAARLQHRRRTPVGVQLQPDGVRLLHDQVAEGGGQGAGGVVLGDDGAVRPLHRAHLHALAGVHHHPRDEVRFLLVLLQVVAFGAAVDLPVDVPDVVAGGVLAVLGELDGEPVPRASVPPGEVALDHLPGVEFQAVDAGEDVGVSMVGIDTN